MRLTQLRSFYAVARMGNFTKAAAHLHVSQPTITTQVRLLEESYNVELFHRRGRLVQLTGVGEQLMQLAQQIFSIEADAVHLLGDAGELRSGHLRVAAVGPYHVTKLLVDFNQHYPGVKVSVSTGNSQDVLDRLLDYRADVGVLAQLVQDDRFLSMPFNKHPVVVFTSSAHRFARRRNIRIADLQGERLILREQGSTTRKALEQALEKAKIRPEIVMEIASREVIREAVAQGIGIAAVSLVEYAPGPGLHMVKISNAEIYTYAHVVCLVERREMRMVSAFFDTMTSSLHTALNGKFNLATRARI